MRMPWTLQADSLRADLVSELAETRSRVAALELAKAKAEHVHQWRYGKVIEGSEDSFSGKWTMWTWECTASNVCGLGKASTNSLSHVPPHFPAELR